MGKGSEGSIGKTIGLIKALAPKPIDPEDVKSAVDDYLDEHPEATCPIDDTAGAGDTGKVLSADKVTEITDELSEAIENDGIQLFNATGVLERRDFVILKKTTLAPIFQIDLTEGVAITISLKLKTALDANAWVYLKDASGNNLLPGGDKTITAGTTTYAFDFTPGASYKNAVLKLTTGASGTTDANFEYVKVAVKGVTIKSIVEVSEEVGALEDRIDEMEEEMPGNVAENVADAMVEIEIPVVQTKQLFDRSKVTPGYCENTGYINTSNTNYVYTDIFPVTAGKTIYFSSDGVKKDCRYVCAYNENGEVVSASGSSSNTYTYTVPDGIVAIRITYSNPAVSSSFAHYQAEYDGITGYTKYGKVFNDAEAIGKPNILYGKKWVVCGDSFTHGVTDGKIESGRYQGKQKVYMYFIGSRNDMDIVDFSEGGRTLAFPETPGDFTNSLTNPNNAQYYQNIPADADYITIYLGINDCSHRTGDAVIPIGEITDDDTTTYYGAWNEVIPWLMENRPLAHLGIIVCNGTAEYPEYTQAQIAIAEKYGIPYINLNGDQHTPAMHRSSNASIPSAVKQILLEKWRVSENNSHPNDAAHLFESTFIENFLRSI